MNFQCPFVCARTDGAQKAGSRYVFRGLDAGARMSEKAIAPNENRSTSSGPPRVARGPADERSAGDERRRGRQDGAGEAPRGEERLRLKMATQRPEKTSLWRPGSGTDASGRRTFVSSSPFRAYGVAGFGDSVPKRMKKLSRRPDSTKGGVLSLSMPMDGDGDGVHDNRGPGARQSRPSRRRAADRGRIRGDGVRTRARSQTRRSPSAGRISPTPQRFRRRSKGRRRCCPACPTPSTRLLL